MAQAGKCCLAWLNPAEQMQPTGGYELAHDTGRWWDAMLRYEAVTGTRIPEAAETAMLRNLRVMTDNPAALLTNSDKLPGPVDKIKVNPHNLRETLLAYTALVRHRKSDWARQQGRTVIGTMHDLLEADGQMDYEKLAAMIGRPLTKDLLMMQRSPAGQWFNATGSTGRAIEAIVWFHEATGDEEALALAGRLAEVHLGQVTDPSGKVKKELLDPAHVGHTHSYCGTLRGLLLYGLAADDTSCVKAVTETYRNGLWGTAISHSGWTPHDQGKIRFANKEGEPLGEHASCGDVAQLALWLALRAGHVDLLDDVERLIRARLLPSQIRDEKNPRRDGAWGVYSHPFGFGSILDVFAAVLHSLADFQEHSITVRKDGLASVNMHFDAETPTLSVSTARDETASQLRITVKQPTALRIRVPAWAPRESVQLALSGKALPLHWDGPFVKVEKSTVSAGDTLSLSHPLPEHETVEEMPISHRKFALSWRGDAIVACTPHVPIYPQ